MNLTLRWLKADVREYWIVDPENRQISVYQRQDEKVFLETYTFDDIFMRTRSA